MDDDTIGAVITGLVLAVLCVAGIIFLSPREPEVKYIYDDEARLVGFCNGKYLIRTEEDEFPSGCQFIEPIAWKD